MANTKTTKNKKQLTYDDVKKLYIDENRTITETANALGTSNSAVYNFMKKHNISKPNNMKYNSNCPSKNELLKMLRDNDYKVQNIAKAKNVSRMTVYNWLHQYDIPTKRETQTSSDELYRLAVDKKKSLNEIAETLDCTEKVAKRNLEAAGFELYIGE